MSATLFPSFPSLALPLTLSLDHIKARPDMAQICQLTNRTRHDATTTAMAQGNDAIQHDATHMASARPRLASPRLLDLSPCHIPGINNK